MTAPKPLRNDCFALPPGVDWTPVDEALSRLRDRLTVVTGTETRGLDYAIGAVLAEPAIAAASHPPFANAAVDGFAFALDTVGDAPHYVPLAPGRAAAGAAHSGVVPPGHGLRILTGARLPEGADTIVLEEDCDIAADHILFDRGLKRGANTRPMGEDVTKGDTLLMPGRVLTAGDIGLLATSGVAQVVTHSKLRVAVLSTGDELVAAGAGRRGDQIHDANRPMLLSMLRRWGYDAVDLGHAPDDPDAIRAALDHGAAQADAILTSGGASAGDEDHVSALLRNEGNLSSWRIALKPGRPLALALWQGTPVFGLPGNPVAAFVCTLIFARPAFHALAGAAWQEPLGFLLKAAFTKNKKPGRSEYLRARRFGPDQVEVFASEGSGRVSGLSFAEGLVSLPPEAAEITPGTPVRYIPFSEFGL